MNAICLLSAACQVGGQNGMECNDKYLPSSFPSFLPLPLSPISSPSPSFLLLPLLPPPPPSSSPSPSFLLLPLPLSPISSPSFLLLPLPSFLLLPLPPLSIYIFRIDMYTEWRKVGSWGAVIHSCVHICWGAVIHGCVHICWGAVCTFVGEL